ncbi:MAG: hypothetical protein DRH57_02740 [Candidatus Cloacimonadota bacterium]|nr:MAG: hypothetical protein DRH57_02740 [Candidatus Cloacimonadota bacterium]
MKIIDSPIKRLEIIKNYNHFFTRVIKAVVDIEREVIALDAELHSDLEAILLDKGSKQKNLWGVNLYLNDEKNRIEYTALINIRPSLKNPSMEILDERIRKKIQKIIERLILD